MVNSLPQDTVRLEIEADKLKIGCGTFTASINGIAAEEFPTIPTLSDTKKTKAESLKAKEKALKLLAKKKARRARSKSTTGGRSRSRSKSRSRSRSKSRK